MLELFTKKTKKVIGIAALTCFLATPISYTMSVSSAAAAALDNQIQFDQRHEPRHDRDNDRWDKDKKRPPKNDRWDKDKNPPPRHDRDDRDDRDDDSDKDYDKGDITAAVLIGGVIGAIIAKNT